MISRRHIAAVVKLLLAAAVLWGVHRTISAALADLEEQNWSPSELRPGWLAISGVAYLAGLLPSSLFWNRLLRLFGQPAHAWGTVRSWYVGSLGKYVPGKAMVIVLRTALLRRDGVGIAVSTATIFYETLTTMAVGAFLAGAILLVTMHDNWQLVLLAAGLLVAAGAPTAPPIFKRLARLAGIERRARCDSQTRPPWLARINARLAVDRRRMVPRGPERLGRAVRDRWRIFACHPVTSRTVDRRGARYPWWPDSSRSFRAGWSCATWSCWNSWLPSSAAARLWSAACWRGSCGYCRKWEFRLSYILWAGRRCRPRTPKRRD